MYRLTVDPAWSLGAWRANARRALQAGVPPEAIAWHHPDEGNLFGAVELPCSPAETATAVVPRAFLPLAARVLAHRTADRHGRLYRLLWRIAHGEPQLLRRITDPDVHRAQMLALEVRRDVHKMKAFVRFRALPGAGPGQEVYMAWFEPEHYIVDLVAAFFMRRFAGMHWAILTPYRSVAWDGSALTFGSGALRSDVPAEDAQDGLWRAYYAHIFNPARLNMAVMSREMPKKYWRNLPEARLLPDLIRNAASRSQQMVERTPRPPGKPRPAGTRPHDGGPVHIEDCLAALRIAADCRRCPLWKPATRTVFGEGPQNARVLVVGEQPGDQEDLSGKPFVGPAGKLFDRALQELDIDRAGLYVTNAVKHFKFERRGKFRLHRSPDPSERAACQIWLERELSIVRPQVVVCLGAIAAQAVFGRTFRLMENRGVWQSLPDGTRAFATVHPSWVLRQRSGDARQEAYTNFVDDMSLLRDAHD